MTTPAQTPDLRSALRDAIDLAEEGWGYVDAYFRETWGYTRRLAELRAALAASPAPLPAQPTTPVGESFHRASSKLLGHVMQIAGLKTLEVGIETIRGAPYAALTNQPGRVEVRLEPDDGYFATSAAASPAPEPPTPGSGSESRSAPGFAPCRGGRPQCACGCGRALVDSDPAPFARPCDPASDALRRAREAQCYPMLESERLRQLNWAVSRPEEPGEPETLPEGMEEALSEFERCAYDSGRTDMEELPAPGASKHAAESLREARLALEIVLLAALRARRAP